MLHHIKALFLTLFWGLLSAQQQPTREDADKINSNLQREAGRGNATAQFLLGLTYRQGNASWGISLDYKEAVKWFRKAADQGEPGAQYYLSGMYLLGQGVTQDYKEAVNWLRKVAQHEPYEILALNINPVALARSTLGTLYTEGLGVSQDYVLAHMWLNLASSISNGEKQAKYAKERDLIAEKMTQQQISEAQSLAREWKPTKSK